MKQKAFVTIEVPAASWHAQKWQDACKEYNELQPPTERRVSAFAKTSYDIFKDKFPDVAWPLEYVNLVRGAVNEGEHPIAARDRHVGVGGAAEEQVQPLHVNAAEHQVQIVPGEEVEGVEVEVELPAASDRRESTCGRKPRVARAFGNRFCVRWSEIHIQSKSKQTTANCSF